MTVLLQTERNEVDSRVGQCRLALNCILALVAQTCIAVKVQQSCYRAHFKDVLKGDRCKLKVNSVCLLAQELLAAAFSSCLAS